WWVISDMRSKGITMPFDASGWFRQPVRVCACRSPYCLLQVRSDPFMQFMLRKSVWLLGLLLVGAVLSVSRVPVALAQGNLLQDPSFESTETYKRVAEDTDGTYFDVPPAWSGWILRGSGGETWQNRVPTGFPHTGLFKIDQARSFHISRGFATFTTAVFQTV